MSETKKPETGYRPATQMVHGGVMRSQWGETSEALFMTQGYVYDSAEAQEARFNGEEPGYVYSRYANPTVSMFENRMALLEGAEGARGTASGMAAVSSAMLSCVRAGDHVVAASALFGSCLYIVLVSSARWWMAPILRNGKRRCVRTPAPVSSKARPTPCCP
jgi:O-succinylhomoserine sulfhydrylase